MGYVCFVTSHLLGGYNMEIIAYEMKYEKDDIEKDIIPCIPFEQKYFQQYMKIYNACFYEMRKSLDIEPYSPNE